MVIKKRKFKVKSSRYVTRAPDGSKLKTTAIICIFTLIKMGIDDRKVFRKFLAAHNMLPNSETTLTEYIMAARKKIDLDFGNTAWLTEKIQIAHLDDFRKIYESTDLFIEENKKLLGYIYQKAKLRAQRLEGDESKFPLFLDYGAVTDILHTGLEANGKKRELMEKGFFVYSFKRYVDTLQARLSGDITEEEKQNILNNDPMLKSIEMTREKEQPININVKYKPDEDPRKEFQLKEHLKGVEKKYKDSAIY